MFNIYEQSYFYHINDARYTVYKSNIKKLVPITRQFSWGLNKEGAEKRGKVGELIYMEYWKSNRCPYNNHKIGLIIGKEDVYLMTLYIHKVSIFVSFIIRLYILISSTNFNRLELVMFILRYITFKQKKV